MGIRRTGTVSELPITIPVITRAAFSGVLMILINGLSKGTSSRIGPGSRYGAQIVFASRGMTALSAQSGQDREA